MIIFGPIISGNSNLISYAVHNTALCGDGFWRSADTVTDTVENMSDIEGEVVVPISDKNPPLAPTKQTSIFFLKPAYTLAKCLCKNSGGSIDYKDCRWCNPTL